MNSAIAPCPKLSKKVMAEWPKSKSVLQLLRGLKFVDSELHFQRRLLTRVGEEGSAGGYCLLSLCHWLGAALAGGCAIPAAEAGIGDFLLRGDWLAS